MALNANILGEALYNASDSFNEIDISEANLEQARLNRWVAVATAIIDHFKNNGVLHVPGAGLSAPNGPVTGNATGSIE